jgi:hypothetical protein
LLMDRNEMSTFHRGPPIDPSYQVSTMNWITDKYASKTPPPNEIKLGWNHLWKVLYKDCSFRPDPLTNMGATGNACFWLADLKNSSLLKPIFRNRPIRNKNRLWWPCLLMDRNEMSTL